MEPPILRYFEHDHLPYELSEVAAPFQRLARQIVDRTPDSAERSAGLRKLLEAKDCIVRASIPVGD